MNVKQGLTNSAAIIGAAVSVMLGASLFLVTLLLFTHQGNRLLLQVAQSVEPRFSANLDAGSLLRSVQLSDIRWQNDAQQIHIKHLDYDFDWHCFTQRICLKSFTADGVNITLPAPQAQPEKQADDTTFIGRIDIPVDVRIENAVINNVHFKMDELALELKQFRLKGQAFSDQVTLAPSIDGLSVVLPNTPVAPAVVKKGKQVKQPLSFEIEKIPALLTQSMLPSIALPLNLQVTPLSLSDINVQQNDKSIFQLQQLESIFSFNDSELSITKFELALPETDLSLTADVNFIEDYPLQVTVKGNVKTLKQLADPTLLNNVHYHLQSEGRLSDLHSTLTLSEGIEFTLATQLNLLADNLPHQLNLSWKQLQWPLQGQAQYVSAQGELSSRGRLDDYDLRLAGHYALHQGQSGKLSLQAKGDLQQAEIDKLSIDAPAGEAQLEGVLAWHQQLNWQGVLGLDIKELALLAADYPGYANGNLPHRVLLTSYDDGSLDWQFDVDPIQIKGELLKRALALSGHVSGDHLQGVQFDRLLLENGDNQIWLDGVYAAQSDLNLQIDIAQLSGLVAQAQGEINANVHLTGALAALNVETKIDSNALAYQQNNVENLHVEGNLLLTEQPVITLRADADNVRVAEQHIDRVTLAVAPTNNNVNASNADNQATLTHHHVELNAKNSQYQLQSELLVTQAAQQFSALVEKTQLQIGEHAVNLANAFAVSQQDDQIDVGAHCWLANNAKQQDAGRLCIEELNVGTTGDIVVQAEQIKLAELNPFLPKALRLNGALSGAANVHWLAQQKPDLDINLHSDDLRITLRNQDTPDSQFAIETFMLSAQGDQHKLEMDAQVFSPDVIDIKADATLHNSDKTPQIDAQIVSALPDFSAFLGLLPMLELLEGQLNSQLAISGPLNKPQIKGVVQLQNGAVIGHDIPMKMAALNANIAIENNTAMLHGSFDSSDNNTLGEKTASVPLISNTLNLLDKSIKIVTNTVLNNSSEEAKTVPNPGVAFFEGQIDWAKELRGDIRVHGQHIEIYDYGKIDLVISPDIHLLLAEHLSINGELLVNRGKVVVESLPEGAIAQSPDIVVVDDETAQQEKQLPIIIDLKLDTGSDLQIVALGLDTFVEGQLSITQPYEKDLSINGALDLSDGSYRSLGQQLVLQDSRIIFQGAAESPYLQIEAIRDTTEIEDDVIAGVRVTGTPDELTLEIFSEPAMAQQEALSYLTRGKGLSSDSEDNSTMANLLIDLAAAQSSGVMSNIGEEIGIKDLALTSSGSGDEQAVGISGEIAPGIELGYGVGVFDSFSVLSLRYELFERFYIEASSSVYQAIDAYYEWDWD